VLEELFVVKRRVGERGGQDPYMYWASASSPYDGGVMPIPHT